jgi:predicted nucleotidyltransferase component of viral defense system
MEILTAGQRALVSGIGRSPLREAFFLTGGTALSAFYLHHRYSDDLDFFTEDPLAVPRVASVMEKVAGGLGAAVQFRRIAGSFLECFVTLPGGEVVELDFAVDAPFRFGPRRFLEALGIEVDNLTDIATNKLSALYDRSEPKDFVDVYAIHREVLPFADLVERTRQKHVGLDPYWLAQACARIRDVRLLPRLIKPGTLDELRVFFEDQARRLMAGAEQPRGG